jgi:TolB protein
MKRFFTWITIFACISLLTACAPGSSPTANVQPPTEIPATAEPTPTATAIPTKPLVVVSNDSGNWQLYFINSDGSGFARVTDSSMIEGTFDYSPDRSQIAFETYLEDEGNSEIYLMQADGSNPTRLTTRSQNDWGPVWSPDGSKLVFQSNLGDNNYEVFVMNADGSGIQNLSNSNGVDAFPVWSPDGTRIAYDSGGSLKAEDIYSGANDSFIKIVNADGSGKYSLPTLEDAGVVSYPQWSPDGSQILFGCGGTSSQTNSDNTVDLQATQGVCVASVDGSSVQRVYSTPVDLNAYGVNYRPYAVWSPDGSRILFIGLEVDGTTQLYTMNPDGSGLTKLTNSAEEMKCLPSWSPDGSMISFIAQQGSLLRRQFTAYTMFADGSNITLLLGPSSGQPHPEWLE